MSLKYVIYIVYLLTYIYIKIVLKKMKRQVMD